ncbi:MAG: aminopeptidase P family protein [Trueperaceae bacterium]|nr:aminopeptidase P family protein [Trueperaceae bacterium]MCO5173230.1 M24 family metallopeptidase [Trueperaceae bacterium]MCW5818679.1 aminopeptidase P family protein [Trueperaceae bacterium]
MDWLPTVQDELGRQGLDAWLVYDFRRSNPVAAPVLGPLLEGNTASRRVFLLVPREGFPTLAVHAIEVKSLRPAPGVNVVSYSSRESLRGVLEAMLKGRSRVAMEYSPAGDNPYVGRVDAGTVEWIRSFGVEVVSSGDVAQVLEVWTPEQLEQHLTAAAGVAAAKDAAFAYLAERARRGEEVRECAVQAVIMRRFADLGLVSATTPNVSFGAHAGDPHYHPIEGVRDAALAPGDVVLIDLWAKVDAKSAPYADVTWMGVDGEPTSELMSVWEAVKGARDAAVAAMRAAYAEGRWPSGGEADRAARAVLEKAGYGDAFTHRTGHSLGKDGPHGVAVHLDDFETSDARALRPGIGVTVEPGAYFQGFGVRSEINVYLTDAGPRVTTELQDELERL